MVPLKGLRQEDQLSPFLFTLVADSLSQIIVNAENNSIFKGFHVGSNKVSVSHIQLADDTLIFMDDRFRNQHFIKPLIQCFKVVTGLKVN